MMQISKYYIILLGFWLVSCSRPVSKFAVVSPEESYEAPVTIKFENQSEEAERYLWDFGDGSTSTEFQPEHRYLHSGNYLVQLTAFKGEKGRTFEQRVQIIPPEKCLVLLQTDQGEMLIHLLDDTPGHRDNFIKLVEEGFYNGLIFHRVIDEFMIQGGDPNSKEAPADAMLGSGGPGYQIPAEFHDNHYHFKGALAAARTGDAVNPEKKSSGSQFYIVHGREVTDQMLSVLEAQKGIEYSEEVREQYKKLGGTPFLDQEYTVFGQVIQGMDVIDNIASVKTNQANRPTEDIKMKIIAIK